ncbi:MAG: DUF7467 domain-containing protein, partial [Planctomycetota bacterium]
ITLLALAAGLVTLSARADTGDPQRTAAVENVDTSETFATIQEAIDDAETLDGHTLQMLVDEHSEGPQIHVNKDLTIKGGSPGSQDTIKAAGDTGNSGDARGWFLVDAGVVLHVRDLVFDGNGYLIYQAFRHRGSGSFTTCGFTGIKYNESGPHYSGLGIAAFGDDGPVHVSGCTFDQIGRIGVLYFGSGVSGSVYSGNVYTGKGDGDWLDYGVELGAGAVATIINSTITDCRGVASSDGSTSAGILATTYYGPGTAGTVSSTTVTANTTGIFVGYDGSDTTAFAATYNSIFGNTSSGLSSTGPLVDALNNWWGDASGPRDLAGALEADSPPCFDPDPNPVLDVVNSDGLGNDVSDGNVAYCPWLLSPATLSLNPDDTCYGGGAGATVTVAIRMSDVKDYVVGGQFFLAYDKTKLEFASAEPGDAPFMEEVYEFVDDIAGTIDYAVGAPAGHPGTPLATDMAVLTFTALIDTCGTAELVTFRPHDPPTRLTNDFGDWIVVITNDLGSISIDGQSPVITLPDDITITCKEDSGPDHTGWATADDNCDPDPQVTFSDTTSGDCVVLITRTWTATDECGNSVSADQTITVIDDIPPVLTLPPDITITCKDDSGPDHTGWATATDNCDPGDPVIGFSDVVTGNCPVLITRTWMATDECGNQASGDQLITVVDDIPPVLMPPPDITISCKESTDPSHTGEATATDNCDPGDPVIGYSDVVTGDCPVIIIRTWTATDECDNTAGADQLITVVDDIPPILIGVPGDITVECDSVPPPADVTAQDNCSDVIIEFAQTSSGNCPTIITRTWTAIDECDNTSSDSQTITAIDTTSPLITCPDDITAQIDVYPDCAADVDPGTAIAIDNCDPDPTVEGERSDGQPLDALYPPGITTIVWTATDQCSNEAECEQTITVVSSGNDCNNNGIPDECEDDCNGNGVPDPCDIGNGTSQDCNGNGIPDECDIDSGACADLNDNGVCDECEVDECIGGGGTNKPRLLILLYTGDDCSGSNHSQDPGSVACTDFTGPGPLPDTVFMYVSNKPTPGGGNEKIWFQGDVSVGETFVPDAANAGELTLSGETCVHVFDVEGGTLLQTTCFHTSCSEPLVPGDQFGTSLLLGVVLQNDLFDDCNGNGVNDALEIELGKALDCNYNGVPDLCDIADGTSDDLNGNGVPDECECPCDCAVPPDGQVSVLDFLALLAQWGGPGSCDCEDPPDGVVDVGDFLALLAAWGPCP